MRPPYISRIGRHRNESFMKQLHPSHFFLLTAMILCIYIVVSHLD